MAVLNTEISPEDPEKNWKLLLQSTANMGVDIIQRGKLSDKKEINDVLMTALQVCLTNTISHAKGNKLYVRFYKSSMSFRAEFTNNGIPPIYKVKEEYGYKELEDTLIKTYLAEGVRLNHQNAVALITMLRNKRMIVQENGRKYSFKPDYHY